MLLLLNGCDSAQVDDPTHNIDPHIFLHSETAVSETSNPRVPLVAAHSGGDWMAVLADSRSSQIIGALFGRPAEGTMAVYFSSNGLPETAFSNGFVFLFDSFHETSLDVFVVDPLGSNSLFRDVSIVNRCAVYERDTTNLISGDNSDFTFHELIQLAARGLATAGCILAETPVFGAAEQVQPLGSQIIEFLANYSESENTDVENSWEALSVVTSEVDCSAIQPTSCAALLAAIAAEISDTSEEAIGARLANWQFDYSSNSIGMELIRIPAGTFQMGSVNGRSFEGPVHDVILTTDFWIGKYEVTQGEYRAVTGESPSKFTFNYNPVEQVSWYDAIAFANALSTAEGFPPCYDSSGNVLGGDVYACEGYRLPTEAEWEYATRAGTTTEYSFGDDAGQLGDYAWYDSNSGSQANPVGQKQPNSWGLYDVHGNVWEWNHDWFGIGSYSNNPASNPTGPTSGNNRVVRGGSWRTEPYSLRSAYRDGFGRTARNFYTGFRLARTAW